MNDTEELILIADMKMKRFTNRYLSGSDGWQGDWVSVHTNEGEYQCRLGEFLDGDISEEGHSCTYF